MTQSQSHLLAAEMAGRAKDVLIEYVKTKSEVPCPCTSVKKLIWMCCQIEKNSEDWPIEKLHRWIGWIQGCMASKGICCREKLREVMKDAKLAFGDVVELEDLEAHNDPDDPFRLDLGGEG